MDLSKWIWILSFMTIVCQFSYGSALPLLPADDDVLFSNERNEPMERREIRSSAYYPEADLNGQDDDSVVDYLKRNGFQVSEGYQRYPRIKDRVIIPFYSYGKNQGYIRPRPQMLGRQRAYFGYNPWNIESSHYGNRFFSKGRI